MWAKKTLSDAQRNLVNLRPRDTTVAALTALRPPRVLRSTRAPFERQVWRVAAQIVSSRLEGDQDIRLELFDRGYMIAEMPAAACLPARTRDRRAIVNVRRLFERCVAAATSSAQPIGAVVEISGVGFFDLPHGQTGHATNYAELHPVTGMRIAAGSRCK